MGLETYQKKRHFNETPEPKGKKASSSGALKFVVQKHDASHLHYDFRLEMDGVLKSWAVPKGPSLNPDDKRLAMHVEDHPLDYGDFEGIIPEGNYGAGTVIVWDSGTYEPLEADGTGRKEQERSLLRQYHSGKLSFILHGKKLRGEFHMFLMKNRGERAWILTKKKDKYASEKDIATKDKSVISGRTLDKVAKDHGTEVNHPVDNKKKKAKSPPVQLLDPETTVKKKRNAVSTASKKKAPEKSLKAGLKKILEDLHKKKAIKKAAMPKDLVPMMATLVNDSFDDDNWIFEIKWDGYRALAYCNGNKVELVSRNLQSFTNKYPPVTEALKETGMKAVLDGEILAVDEKGLGNFQLLQNWQNSPVQLQFLVFDILWLEGYDLTELPLIARKEILKQLLPTENIVIRYSDHITAQGKKFFDAALSKGLEGIMGKNAESLYMPGKRTADWVKIKANLRQEVVIAGFTKPRNTRKYFGSLLLGVYENEELVYVGHTGSGFNESTLKEIYNKLQPLITVESPFAVEPKTNMPATWVKPKLVCEIKFTEWTRNRNARHPIFMGLRSDKKAKEVVFEKAQTMTETKRSAKAKSSAGTVTGKSKSKTSKSAAPVKKAGSTRKAKPKKSQGKYSGLQLKITGDEKQEIKINGKELTLTNLNKIYWKKEGFRKGDMVNYYLKMAPYIFPHLKDRPQSLNRYPNGIAAPNFYQKDMKGKIPSWLQTHKDYSESNKKIIEYLVCSNEATLIYMANLGCIELHPWHSRTESWQYPDWCLIDLDPDDPNPFSQVIEVALVVKEVLDSIGARAYCKTSGSSGIHIYIPLGAQYDFDQSKQLAHLVVTMVHHQMPSITSLERSPAKRKGKIYLDYLQNRQTQTAASPYSLRPKPGVPVSTPIDWSELKKGLTPTTFTAYNIFDRVKTEGDLFKPVLEKGIDLDKVLSKLARLMK